MEAAKFLDVNQSLVPAYFADRVKSVKGCQLVKVVEQDQKEVI
jgi:hypothetical protein